MASKTANCNFCSFANNLPDIIPANISGYMVFSPFITTDNISSIILAMLLMCLNLTCPSWKYQCTYKRECPQGRVYPQLHVGMVGSCWVHSCRQLTILSRPRWQSWHPLSGTQIQINLQTHTKANTITHTDTDSWQQNCCHVDQMKNWHSLQDYTVS